MLGFFYIICLKLFYAYTRGLTESAVILYLEPWHFIFVIGSMNISSIFCIVPDIHDVYWIWGRHNGTNRRALCLHCKERFALKRNTEGELCSSTVLNLITLKSVPQPNRTRIDPF